MVTLLLALTAVAQGQVFDDTASDRIRVATDRYEVALGKTNGAILGITDRTANALLTRGSRNQCLWGTNYSGTSQYRGGCSYAAGRTDSFTYAWQAADNVLRLDYAAAAMSATVTIAFTPQWFDMKLAVENRTGLTLQTVLFPSDLLFNDADMKGAYLPYYLPGVRIKPEFFAANRSISVVYPSARAFADYMAVEANGGQMAWYTVNPDGDIAPSTFGFQDDERTRAGTLYAPHNFQTWTGDGGRFETPWVRFRIGPPPVETVLHYRADNGIDAYPSLRDKLGERFDTAARAPLVKMDLRSIGRGFADLTARLDLIRVPALLHPVSYWPLGFDRNYPDFLPPDARNGSTADFRTFVEAAHARGLLVMPYTNPTWWDDQSPTSRSVADIAELAVLDGDGKPRYESYGVNRGFVSSPHAPAVRRKVDELMTAWRDEVPVDFVMQDQIGSRSWVRDFHPAAPSPMRYYDAWLGLTAQYAERMLMTEDGWDRLAGTHIGFTGSALTGATAFTPETVRWGPGSRGNTAFGEGLWEPYPLGVWLFHDKVLFYHHDLEERLMNAGVEVLTWNAAFGVSMGYLWPELRATAGSDWIAIATAFQSAVIARTVGRPLSDYRTLQSDVTESRFVDTSVIANWHATEPYTVDGHTIAPSGCLARTDDGSLVAGVFLDRFLDEPLTAGLHYLIVETHPDRIVVRHPSGADTPFTVSVPEAWEVGKGISIQALRRDGQVVTANVPSTVRGHRVSFRWNRAPEVDRYELRPQP